MEYLLKVKNSINLAKLRDSAEYHSLFFHKSEILKSWIERIFFTLMFEGEKNLEPGMLVSHTELKKTATKWEF